MANPQKENGHIQIANEIFEALCKIKINGEARQVLDFIIRKTYGFNKRRDQISLTQFERGTGLYRASVCRSINKLKNMKIIIQIQDKEINTYEFNKHYDEWVVSKLIPSIKTSKKGSINSANRVVSNLIHTKDIYTKDIYTKDNSDLTVAGVEDILNIFYKINPTLNWGNKTTRKACKDLIKQFGLEETKRMAEAVVSIQGKPYAPVATTPHQMKEKLAQFKIYFDRQKNKKPKVAIIK